MSKSEEEATTNLNFTPVQAVDSIYDSIKMMNVMLSKQYKEAKENKKSVEMSLCKHDLKILSKAEQDIEVYEREYRLAIQGNERQKANGIYSLMLATKKEAFKSIHFDILTASDALDENCHHCHCHCEHSEKKQVTEKNTKERPSSRNSKNDSQKEERREYSPRRKEDRREYSPRRSEYKKYDSSHRRRASSAGSRGGRRRSPSPRTKARNRYPSPVPGERDPYYYQRKYAGGGDGGPPKGQSSAYPQHDDGAYGGQDNGPYDPFYYRRKYEKKQ